LDNNRIEVLDEDGYLRIVEDGWCEHCQNYGHKINDCPWYKEEDY